ncbi:hypothetical protein C8J56DRAFT_1060119 [Mycena floridula]|nr:hypothetical protein C8J56DRAFT_1060119 [Mycena floridula]
MSTDCTADIQENLRGAGEFIMNGGLSEIAEAIFWTLYVVSVVLTVCVLWRKGLNTARTALLVLIATIFAIDTSIFALNLYRFFFETREMLLMGIFEGDALDSVEKRSDTVNTMYNILSMLMLIPGDCIVIWRAYAVWTRSRIFMVIPVLFLFGCIVNFPFFVSCNIKHKDEGYNGLGAYACSATNTSGWILSFCANISATLMIFYTAWPVLLCIPKENTRYQRGKTQIKSDSSALAPGRVRIRLFSVDAVDLAPITYYGPGLVFCEVLSIILTPHCAAMVPTLTILLVTLYGSFEEYSTVNISQSIHFATPRVTELAQESDAEANDSHSANFGQERKM